VLCAGETVFLLPNVSCSYGMIALRAMLRTQPRCSFTLSLLPFNHRKGLGQPLQHTLLHIVPKVPRAHAIVNSCTCLQPLMQAYIRLVLRRRLSLICRCCTLLPLPLLCQRFHCLIVCSVMMHSWLRLVVQMRYFQVNMAALQPLRHASCHA
jgi:hypothetical protein